MAVPTGNADGGALCGTQAANGRPYGECGWGALCGTRTANGRPYGERGWGALCGTRAANGRPYGERGWGLYAERGQAIPMKGTGACPYRRVILNSQFSILNSQLKNPMQSGRPCMGKGDCSLTEPQRPRRARRSRSPRRELPSGPPPPRAPAGPGWRGRCACSRRRCR